MPNFGHLVYYCLGDLCAGTKEDEYLPSSYLIPHGDCQHRDQNTKEDGGRTVGCDVVVSDFLTFKRVCEHCFQDFLQPKGVDSV